MPVVFNIYQTAHMTLNPCTDAKMFEFRRVNLHVSLKAQHKAVLYEFVFKTEAINAGALL